VKRIRELTNGLGADIVLETANHPSTVPLAVNLAAARGRVHLFGLYPEATMSPLTPPRRRDDGRGRGDASGISCGRFRCGIQEVRAEPMVGAGSVWIQAKEAFDAFSHGDAVKVLFEM
jgi:threonine dehydrogenase-like Zn-dependent dehydrogenase